MGSNNKNQLGIGDSENKYSPVLIETLIDLKIKDVKCGNEHCLVVCENKNVYSWGNNEYG